MRFRKLRIAWSVACSVVAVLLVVLWVRSYSFNDLLHRVDASGWMLGIESDVGTSALIYGPLSTPPTPGMGPKGWFLQTTKAGASGIRFGLKIRNGLVYLAAPYYVLALAIALVAVVPWVRFRFTLRTLLIATTLVAVVLGLIVLLNHP
jgi:hypothetical protein